VHPSAYGELAREDIARVVHDVGWRRAEETDVKA
jgi:hypothetical protein